jgi:phage gp16-like protein
MSANLKPKTTSQVRAIFGLVRRAGIDDDLRHEMVLSVTGKTSVADLTFDEANKVIKMFKGVEFKTAPRRTTLHRRQRANVQQVAQPAHLDLMRSLANHRGMTEDGLRQLSTRIVKHFPPRTTSETNKVIEALKAMNKRGLHLVA